jgi:hypothetical protein
VREKNGRKGLRVRRERLCLRTGQSRCVDRRAWRLGRGDHSGDSDNRSSGDGNGRGRVTAAAATATREFALPRQGDAMAMCDGDKAS